MRQLAREYFALQQLHFALAARAYLNPIERMNVESLRALIADHLAVEVSSVRDEASFVDDLGADSLDVIELAMRFEEALNIPIDNHETEACMTVRDALDLVQSKLTMEPA